MKREDPGRGRWKRRAHKGWVASSFTRSFNAYELLLSLGSHLRCLLEDGKAR